MKMGLVTISLIGLLLLFTRDANAQVYDLYYYWDGSQYQQYSPEYDLYSYGNTNQYPEQPYDPYYQLHVLHYQLYLPQYQSYSYGPCCFGGVVVVPRRHVRSVTLPNVITPQSPISPLPRFVTTFPKLFRQKIAQHRHALTALVVATFSCRTSANLLRRSVGAPFVRRHCAVFIARGSRFQTRSS